jgi:hypothetical protein
VTQVLARIRQLSAVDTLGGSRMRESRLYGSGRGARGNSRPYRERCRLLRCMSPFVAQNRHADAVAACLLLGDERTSLGCGPRSEFDPERTSPSLDPDQAFGTREMFPWGHDTRDIGLLSFTRLAGSGCWRNRVRAWALVVKQRALRSPAYGKRYNPQID